MDLRAPLALPLLLIALPGTLPGARSPSSEDGVDAVGPASGATPPAAAATPTPWAASPPLRPWSADETPPPPRAAIDAAIENGAQWLLDQQQDDGSFPYSGSHHRTGATALCVYALLHSGIAPDHEAIRRAIARLAEDVGYGTYDAACLILALAAHDAEQHLGWIEDVADELLTWQNGFGDWGYPGGADLSNTQYAALGLRAAVHAGVDVPDEIWTDLARAVLRYADGHGGFGYSRQGGGTVSMTAAGVGTLAICDEMLTRSGASARDLLAKGRKRRTQGLQWLGKRFSTGLGGGWSYYSLYGLERVGAFEGVTRIGGHDWYAEGATSLLDRQGEDGGWGTGNKSWLAQTSFALLFLKRASRSSVTGVDRPSQKAITSLAPDAAVHLVVVPDDPVTLWIAGWGRPVADGLEWPGEEGRGPHVARVVWMVDDEVAEVLELDPAEPADRERFAIQYEPESAGAFTVRARVLVQRPPTVTPSGEPLPGAPVWIESSAVEVLVAAVTAPHRKQETKDRASNLLARARPRARASSELRPKERGRVPTHPPENAVDNRLRTAWLADPDDERPTLTVMLREPQLADVVLITNARSVPYASAFYARALEIEVQVNGRESYTVRMPPDERAKGRLELDEPVVVQRLDFEIKWTVSGVHPSTGLAEIELQLR